MKKKSVIMSILFLLLFVGTASATIIFDNGAPNQQGAITSPAADDFFVDSADIGASTYLLTDVHFWTWEATDWVDWTGDVFWTIYAHNGSAPPGFQLPCRSLPGSLWQR